ncbi:MAG: hypothetical protein JNM78_16150 [Cyclobacteriaceae bacterium]|nr:hypothetical protein [Cyclobacteriaceae bacterium]
MKRISSFLNSNSVAIQAFSVIFLVIVTLFYAIRTHSMAEVMKRDFELKTQPFLALDMAIGRGFGEVDNKSIQLAFTLKNVGLVPLIYSNDEMEIKGVSINPKRVAITLFPTQTLTLFSNLTGYLD